MEYVIREFLVYRVTDYSGTSGSGTSLLQVGSPVLVLPS